MEAIYSKEEIDNDSFVNGSRYTDEYEFIADIYKEVRKFIMKNMLDKKEQLRMSIFLQDFPVTLVCNLANNYKNQHDQIDYIHEVFKNALKGFYLISGKEKEREWKRIDLRF